MISHELCVNVAQFYKLHPSSLAGEFHWAAAVCAAAFQVVLKEKKKPLFLIHYSNSTRFFRDIFGRWMCQLEQNVLEPPAGTQGC